MSEKAFFEDTTKFEIDNKNKVLRIEFDKMINKGVRNIYYINNKDLKGNDHESTVDGVHFTDLGFLRFAENLMGKFDHFKLTKTIRQ